MVMKAEPLVNSVETLVNETPDVPEPGKEVVLLSPRGRLCGQEDVRRMAELKQLVLVAGRYEGVDERFITATRATELSIGDYVLSGGEIPAMVIVDSVVRLLPGAISDPESAQQDSFSHGLLDCPHYTRPVEFRNLRVPEVLLSGNHASIRRWRKEQAVSATLDRRPELLVAADMDEEERAILEDLQTVESSMARTEI